MKSNKKQKRKIKNYQDKIKLKATKRSIDIVRSSTW